MAVQDISEHNSTTILTTLQRIELTLQALPDELAASRVATLSEEEAKQILAKRHARISYWSEYDKKIEKKVRRYGWIEESSGLIMGAIVIIGLAIYFN